jgi:hypothetical protein
MKKLLILLTVLTMNLHSYAQPIVTGDTNASNILYKKLNQTLSISAGAPPYYGHQDYNLDLNNDGIDDFTFRAFATATLAFTAGGCEVSGLNYNSVIIDALPYSSNFYIMPLNNNYSIRSDDFWYSPTSWFELASCIVDQGVNHCYGVWNNLVNKFIGLWVNIGETFYFAWVRIHVHVDYSSATFNLIDCAIIKPELSVTPANLNVLPNEGATDFQVISNHNWITSCDAAWCVPQSQGTGNDILHVHYNANTDTISRIAHISINVEGFAPVVVTITQATSWGTPDYNLMTSLTLYPVPAKGNELLCIESRALTDPMISCRTCEGKLIWSRRLQGKEKFQVDISDLPGRYYLLTITCRGAAITKPLVKL